MNYSSAWFDGDRDAAAGAGAARQGAPRASPRGRRAAGRSACWRSAAAGARWPRSRRASGAQVDRRHAVDRAARLGAGSGWPRAGVAQRADLRLQDYRDVRRRRRSTRSCRSRCSRPSAASTGTRYFDDAARAAQARRPAPASRASRSATTCSSATRARPTSSSSTSSPAACCPAPSLFAQQAAAARPARDRPPRLRRRLRRDAAPLARTRSSARRTTCARQGFDERFMRLWEFYLAYCEAAFDAGQHRRRAVHAAARCEGRVLMRWRSVLRRLGVAGMLLGRRQVLAADPPSAAAPPPPEIASALPAARCKGTPRCAFSGFAIYEARLWAAAGFAPERYDDARPSRWNCATPRASTARRSPSARCARCGAPAAVDDAQARAGSPP